MKWTTPEQFVWLRDGIPQFHKARRDKGKLATWFADTTSSFLDTFALPVDERVKAPKRIKKWFYHHSKSKSPKTPSANFDLLPKPSRKLVRLTPAQAYTRLFCTRDSALYGELYDTWKLYTSADKATLAAYKHLFPGKHNPNLPFVTFQQCVLKEKITAATEEELSAIQEFIEARFQEDTKLRQRPWESKKIDDLQSDVDLERAYVQDQVDSLSESLEAVCDEVKHVTNYNTFIITGGPTPMGSGGFQIFHVEAGQTRHTGQTFEQFLGPWWGVLTTKFGEWLRISYSREETLRLEGSVRGESQARQTPFAKSSGSTPAPSQPPSLASADVEMATDPIAQTPSRTTPTPHAPPHASTTSCEILDDTLDEMSDAALDDTLDGMLDGFLDIPPDELDPTPDDLTISPSSPRRASNESPPHSRTSSESPPPPSHVSSSPHLVPAASSSPSEPEPEPDWVPSHCPQWTLGPRHLPHVHASAPYLVAVPGGHKWENLLGSYVVFESLSSAGPGSSKFPAKPRPEELGRWFKYGRKYAKKDVPAIKSIRKFDDEWVAWWAACQPEWRDTSVWPFEQGCADGRDWGDLVGGGKDGVFLALVSLGWWVLAKDSSADSRLNDAIADVTWVINGLVYSLSIAATAPSVLDSSPPPPTSSRAKRSTQIKSGPSGKPGRRGRG